MIIQLLAAAAEAAPENKFGFWEAMEQGGAIAWFIFSVLVIMSVGSFYILITKLLEIFIDLRSGKRHGYRGKRSIGGTSEDHHSLAKN